MLVGGAEGAIREFRRYVVAQYAARSRHWRHARSLMERAASTLALEFWDGVNPVDLSAVARFLDARIVISPNSAHGYLRPVGDHFEVVVPEGSSSRGRFSIAHECGHVLFYGGGINGYARLCPYGFGTEKRGRSREEGLCHAFAGALLIPEPVSRRLAEQGASLSLGSRAARALGVSLDVMLKRLVWEVGAWDESVFCSLWMRRGKVRVDAVIRGGRRRGSSDRAPTREQLSEFLESRLIMTWDEALRRAFDAKEVWALHGERAWIRF